MQERRCSYAAILVLGLLVFIGSAWPIVVHADEQVRISGVIYLGDLPTAVADREGFFKRRGLDASVEYQHSGQENLQRLRTGETDFALMALTPLVIDRLADNSPGERDDPVILASLVHSIHLNHVLVLQASEIMTPADLAGRRVALQMGTNAEFVWWLFAHMHGIEAASIELVDRSVSQIPDGLANGEFDAAVIWEPWTSRLEDHFGLEVRRFTGSDVYTAKWVLVTNRNFISRHPGRVRAVLSAYHDAIESIGKEPEAAIRVFSEHTDMSPDILRRNRNVMHYALNLDWTVIATLQQQFDWVRLAGYPESGSPLSILSLIETGPLHSIYPEVVRLPLSSATLETPP